MARHLRCIVSPVVLLRLLRWEEEEEPGQEAKTPPSARLFTCCAIFLLLFSFFFKSSPPKRFFSKPPGRRRRRKTRHPTLLSRESCFSQRRCCFLSFSYFSSGSLLSFYLSSCIFEPRWRPVCTWPRPHGGRETSESRHHPPTQSKSNRADVQQLPSFVLTHSLRVVRGLCACTRAKTQKEKRAAAAS